MNQQRAAGRKGLAEPRHSAASVDLVLGRRSEDECQRYGTLFLLKDAVLFFAEASEV